MMQDEPFLSLQLLFGITPQRNYQGKVEKLLQEIKKTKDALINDKEKGFRIFRYAISM